ncbi:hypothetical protein GQ600_4312 [Phytophthora cactorum]|nr:hypothetical protein GQ600_4312 [Phytophthora cactorum]
MPDQAADANAPSLDEVEVEQDRVAGESDGGYIESNEEEAVIERNLVFLEDHVPTEDVPPLVPFGAGILANSRVYKSVYPILLSTFYAGRFRSFIGAKYVLQLALKYKRRPDIFEGFDNITLEQLSKALDENEARVQRRMAPPREGNADVDRFLKTVELSPGQCGGKDAFAYQTLYGQPALFVTLTPNVATSSAMAHYTGASKIKTMSIGH